MKYARLLARFIFTHLVWKPRDNTQCLCGGDVCEGTEDRPGKRYVCKGCDRSVLWCFGGDDNLPFHCDDCWALDDASPIPPTLNAVGLQSRRIRHEL